MFEEGATLKRQHGDENVFDLSLGNPVMEPPPQFHEELRKLANNPQPGMHRYMPNAGYGETRAAGLSPAAAAFISKARGLKAGIWGRSRCKYAISPNLP